MLLFTLEILHDKRKCFEDCFFNVKIITWSLCCWPQDLQRIINFELTDTSNNQYCTVLVKRSFCAQVSLSLKLQQRCNRRTHNETMSYSFFARIHCVYHRWFATLKTYKSQPHIISTVGSLFFTRNLSRDYCLISYREGLGTSL